MVGPGRTTQSRPTGRWWYSSSLLHMVLDVALLLLAWLPTVVLNAMQIRPMQNMISCADDTLYATHRDSSVPMSAAMILCVGLNVLQILSLEVWHSVKQQKASSRGTSDASGTVSSCSGLCAARVAHRTYQVLLLLAFGSAAVEVLTEGVKLLVGRPRPNFWALCSPSDSQICNRLRFVSEENLGCRASADVIDGARKSFPSGHSSQSSFWMTAAALYLQRRLPDQRAPSLLLKPLVQLLWTALALGIALSRLVDHKHHPWDVAAGCGLGAVVALALFQGCSVLRRLNRITYQHTSYILCPQTSNPHQVQHPQRPQQPNGGSAVQPGMVAATSRSTSQSVPTAATGRKRSSSSETEAHHPAKVASLRAGQAIGHGQAIPPTAAHSYMNHSHSKHQQLYSY